MAVTTPRARRECLASANGALAAVAAPADLGDARYQAFALLSAAFTVAPIAFGLEKFFSVMVDWLGAIVVSPLTFSGLDGIVLGDVGLLLAAVTLARRVSASDAPRR